MRYTPTCMHNECDIHVRVDNARNTYQPCGPSPEAGCTTRASDGQPAFSDGVLQVRTRVLFFSSSLLYADAVATDAIHQVLYLIHR